MKKFIALIIVLLPVVAVVSTFAGFYYGGQIKRTAAVQRVEPVTAELPALPTVAPVRSESSPFLLRVQLSFCFDAMQTLVNKSRIEDVNGVRICVDNLRGMNPPAEYQADTAALVEQFTGFADEYEAAIRDTDAGMLEKAGNRIGVIGGVMERVLKSLPD